MINSMPKEIKDKWIAALRSGKYKQGKYRLENDGGYCCLGVLQKVVDDKVERDKDDIALCVPSFEWLEKNNINFKDCDSITARDASIAVNNKLTSLTTMNDTQDADFLTIADAIDKNIEGV